MLLSLSAKRSLVARMMGISNSRVSVAVRSFSSTVTIPASNSLSEPSSPKSLITGNDGVHSNMKLTSKQWRNKPLFRRQGDVRFKTGIEAAQLLVKEALRRDAHETDFITSVQSNLLCLSPIFDRNPKYAFVAKTLIEPERLIQFRVAWIDDANVVRMNRGYRIQYNSSIAPYAGSIHFGSHINNGIMKAFGFDSVFSNALTGFEIGAAIGGSDFNPLDKSESELQRFCQSYMTELSKYISPSTDTPWMGMGVGQQEMGYLFGQYKRIHPGGSSSSHQTGRSFLSGDFHEAPGYGVAHFANEILQGSKKHESLEGKRCLIIGGGKVARSLAEKLLKFGAIPLTFSDASGHVYEPDGITEADLKVINKIKDERGALLGRYIINSTTAQFNHPASILDIPCDLCFPCGAIHDIDEHAVAKLHDHGCYGIIEGGHSAVTPEARKAIKKRGMLYGPHNLTLTGSAIVHCLGNTATDELLAEHVARIYQDVKQTATEFNARGDLFTGANILGFMRVANVMMTHGAV